MLDSPGGCDEILTDVGSDIDDTLEEPPASVDYDHFSGHDIAYDQPSGGYGAASAELGCCSPPASLNAAPADIACDQRSGGYGAAPAELGCGPPPTLFDAASANVDCRLLSPFQCFPLPFRPGRPGYLSDSREAAAENFYHNPLEVPEPPRCLFRSGSHDPEMIFDFEL